MNGDFEHLLLALARDEIRERDLMVDLGVTYANLEVAIITLRRRRTSTGKT